MKKKTILIFIVVVIVFVEGVYLAYGSIFPKAEPIKQIKVSETISTYVYDNNECEIGMSNLEIEELFIYLNEAESTRIMSVNDYPSVRPYYVVEIELVDRYFKYMIYEEKGTVYAELPYEGIYAVDAKVIDVLR